MIQSVFNEYFELFEIKSELVKNMYFKCKMMKLFMLYLNVLLGIPNHRVGDKAVIEHNYQPYYFHNYYNELGLIGLAAVDRWQ